MVFYKMSLCGFLLVTANSGNGTSVRANLDFRTAEMLRIYVLNSIIFDPHGAFLACDPDIELHDICLVFTNDEGDAL